MDELKPEFPTMGKNATVPYCTSICWSADGRCFAVGDAETLCRDVLPKRQAA